MDKADGKEENIKRGKEIELLGNFDDITVQKLIEFGLNINNVEHRAVIEDVSRKALKQWEIEKKLKEIEDIVKVIDIETMDYKGTGTSVLKGVDEVQ